MRHSYHVVSFRADQVVQVLLHLGVHYWSELLGFLLLGSLHQSAQRRPDRLQLLNLLALDLGVHLGSCPALLELNPLVENALSFLEELLLHLHCLLEVLVFEL